MSFVAVAVTAGSAIIGGVLANEAADEQADATRDATEASVQATRDQIAAAERQYQRTREMFQGYLNDGDLADAYLRALYEGQASYTPGAAQGAQTLIDRYPQLYEQWQRLSQPRAGRPRLWDVVNGGGGNDPQTQTPSFIDFVRQTMGEAAVADVINPTPAQTITREQVLGMINNTPMAQAASEWLSTRNELTDETYAGENALADQEYQQLIDVGDLNYNDLAELAQRAREGRLTVAEQNLIQRLGLEDASFAAWLPQSQQAEEDAVNQVFSRGGVTGLVGLTRRGVGETTQNAAMERNLRYLEGRQAAHEPYFDDVTGAEGAYWDALGDASGARADWRGSAVANRANRNRNAFSTRQAGREANFDRFTDDYGRSYAEFNNFMRARSDRGGGARDALAGAGERMTSTMVGAYGDRGAAQREGALAQGAIQQQRYSDFADIAGNLLGSWNRRKRPSGSSGDVSRDEYGWPIG